MRQSLHEMIADHRALHASDLYMAQLVSRQPPVTTDLRTGMLDQEPADANGMNLNARLIRLIGHPEGYGRHLPWKSAVWRLRWHCRRNHAEHVEREEWDGALCQRLTRLVIEGDGLLPDVALELGITGPQAASVLRAALIWVEEDIDRARRDAERTESMVDHQAKGMHFSDAA